MASLNSFRGRSGESRSLPNYRPQDEQTIEFLTEPVGFTWQVEHTSPHDWKKSAVCTYPECMACEQQAFNWNSKIKVYMPIMVDGVVYAFNQATGPNSALSQALTTFAERGTITDVQFLLTRSGTGKRTKYDLQPLADSPAVGYNGSIEVSPYTKVIDYQEQAKFYKFI